MPYRGLAVSVPVFVAKTADFTLTAEDDGKTFTTRGGSSGTITFTLPAKNKVQAGWSARFFAVGAAAMKVASNAADEMVTYNDATASSVLFAESGNIIGAGCSVEFDGTSFLVWLNTQEAVGLTVG